MLFQKSHLVHSVFQPKLNVSAGCPINVLELFQSAITSIKQYLLQKVAKTVDFGTQRRIIVNNVK